MRWALVKVCLAVTVMVVLAFALPLGLAVRELARDRVLADATRQAALLGPVLAIEPSREQLRRAVASTGPGAAGRMALYVPDDGPGAPLELGERRAPLRRVEAVSRGGAPETVTVPGGHVVLQPFALPSQRVAVVQVLVPDAELGRGLTTAYPVLAGVALALVAGSVVVADRLGARVVRSARRLAGAAHELGEGRLGVRVPEEGPAELRSAATAFNAMADQVVELLARERELAADLSHRLRTPLTVLRLNAASLGDGDAAAQTRDAVDQLEHEVDLIISAARAQRPAAPAASAAAHTGCDAAEVIRDRMAFWSALAEDEGRPAGLAGVGRPVRVPVARAELAAALDALLGNVFRHTAEGTAFAVDVYQGSGAVVVLVSDAGEGIADPAAALRRGHTSGGPGSTGLGLDIVRRVAESTGGDVRVGRSVLGGAEVRVRLEQGAAHRTPRRGRRRSRERAGA